MGWEMRNEEAPNTQVHAEDLAIALAKLRAHNVDSLSPMEGTQDNQFVVRRRRTGSSTIVYHPEDHGDSPNLPAISVEDTTESPISLSPTIQVDAMEGIEGPISQQKAQGITVSTARPPVEFML